MLTVLERSTAKVEQIVLGGNCKTETVGVADRHGIWMSPNADFVPVYTRTKALTIKTYDRIGRYVTYSDASGSLAGTKQPDRAIASCDEAYSEVDIGALFCNNPFNILGGI